MVAGSAAAAPGQLEHRHDVLRHHLRDQRSANAVARAPAAGRPDALAEDVMPVTIIHRSVCHVRRATLR